MDECATHQAVSLTGTAFCEECNLISLCTGKH